MILHNSTFQSFLFSSHAVKFNLCATLPVQQRGREDRKEEDGGENDSDSRGYSNAAGGNGSNDHRGEVHHDGNDGTVMVTLVLMVGTVRVMMFLVTMVVTAVTVMMGQ